MRFVGCTILLCRISYLNFTQADPALQRLPAPGLRGTWARAYALLTRLVSQIGWDELLKTRSSVFVMEEEYRMQKAHGDIQKVVNGRDPGSESDGDVGKVVIHEDGTAIPARSSSDQTTLVTDAGADDDASIRAMASSSSSNMHSSSPSDSLEVGGVSIPTIRISTESDRDREEAETVSTVPQEDDATLNGDAKPNGVRNMDTLEKPEQSAAREGDIGEAPTSPNPSQEAFSFSNKRLCERWLDNLFMVLYEVRHGSVNVLCHHSTDVAR
jgi:Chs5-Arf1p-binding protein BUD7/BCH1